jgi:hypothetical protein
MQRSSAKQHPNAYLNSLYGTMQLSYFPEHRPLFPEGSYHSPKKNMRRLEKLSKNTSNEEQSEYLNPLTAPISSMSERKIRNFDPFRTTDP